MVKSTSVFLVGFMGSGKTTLGKKLANKLAMPFVDLDRMITDDVEMSIPEYFQRFGEAEFRSREAESLRSLDLQVPSVVSVGGGTPCYHDNMTWMNQQGITIYLKLPAKALWERLQKSDVTKRPVLKGLYGEDLLNFIQSKLAEREPVYLQSTFVVNQLKDKVHQIIDLCGLKKLESYDRDS